VRVGLFPGQGLDPKTVASALDERDPVLNRADETLGYDLAQKVQQVAKRSRPVLSTAVAQPAIFTAGIMSFKNAVEKGETFDYLIGHSLGEYTALVASGAIPFTQGLKLVAARGAAMQQAGKASPGGMAAVINLPITEVELICAKTGVTIANDNSPEQVVLSGEEEALARAAQMCRSLGGRSVLLPVDGAYHTRSMEPAAEKVARVLETTEVRLPKIPVIANVSASPYKAPGEIRKLLAKQLTNRVRFRESVTSLSNGETEFVDLGPGRVVGRLAQATARHERRTSARA
jgi:malonyl CoA-acyl carrier protein transacylase